MYYSSRTARTLLLYSRPPAPPYDLSVTSRPRVKPPHACHPAPHHAQASFAAAATAAAQGESLRHPRKRNVHAVEQLPILPDFERWPNKYIQVCVQYDKARVWL